MYGFSSIFIYFLSIIIVISAMTFVVLMTVVHEVSRRRQLILLIAFCACNFLIQLLYLGMTVQDVLIKYYRYPVFLRVSDIVLYTLQSYIWCRYLLFYPLRSNSFAARHGRLLCNIIAAFTLVLGIYNYAFNIDNEFLYVNTAAVYIELGSTALVSLMLILTVSGLKRGQNKRFDVYNILITLLLIFIQLSTDICMIAETAVGFSFSAHEYLTGSLQQVLLTLLLALYVYRTDYSGASLRQRLIELAAAHDAVQDSVLHENDELFNQRQLTPREREVARLAYSGLTNPEIADRLCISQYTVKRHMHSIFEKLGISARIELVHLMSGRL